MYVEKIEADRVLRSASEYYRSSCDPDLAEDQPEDNSRIEKRIADYVRVLRPRILVSAKEAVFEHELLAGLKGKFHRATPRPTIESLIENVLVTRARTIVLVDPPASLDPDEVSKRTRCYTLVLRSGGTE